MTYSSWDYRVIRRRTGENEMTFSIHEVFYSDETGRPAAVTEDPVSPKGETLGSLRTDMEHYNAAFEKSVLDFEFFENLATQTAQSTTKESERPDGGDEEFDAVLDRLIDEIIDEENAERK